MSSSRRAFSLLEILAAVTISVIAISTATLGMASLSEESQLRAAAMDLGSLLRLGQTQARGTGHPVALRLSDRGWELLRPMKQEDQWVLAPALRRNPSRGVQVKVKLPGVAVSGLGSMDHEIWIQPDGSNDLTVWLERGQRRARVMLDAWFGLNDMVYLDDHAD